MHIDSSQFSSREKETIGLLLQGKSNKEIALALGVSVSTVEFHLKNIYRKLQVKSRTEAVLQLGKSIGSQEARKQGQSIGRTTAKQRESIVAGIDGNVENDENTIPKRRFSMKQWFFIISGSLLAIALTAALLFAKLQMDKKAQASTSPTVTSGLAGTQVSFEGTSFTIPPDLGSRTLNEYIPASNPGTVVDILAIYPGHRRSILEDYPLRDTSSQPQILIFPAPEFAQMSDCSKATIDGLKKILAAQHISPVMPDTCVSDTDMLPFLPDQYAKQIFRAQEKFLSFRNGTGIRYITQYGLAAFPAVNNMDIFYTFQGLTSDGKYYVSVILPVNLPDLAAEDDPEAFKHPADWQNPEKYPDYLATMLEKLDQEDNPFSPSLESLDALSQSLLVTDQQ